MLTVDGKDLAPSQSPIDSLELRGWFTTRVLASGVAYAAVSPPGYFLSAGRSASVSRGHGATAGNARKQGSLAGVILGYWLIDRKQEVGSGAWYVPTPKHRK